ncbi:MAG: sugar phosphate isomerase/epimerase family protein [Clostridia bacterium]
MIITGISDEAGRDIRTQIKAHKELGWNALELRLHNGVNASTTAFSDEDFNEVRAALDEAKMTVTAFSSAIGNWSRSIRGDFAVDVADLRIAAKRMKMLGTRYIRTMTWVPDDSDMAFSRNEAIRRYKELAKIAGDEGILLAHENCTGWGGLTPRNMLELKVEVDSPNLVLLYDTGNVVSHGDDPGEFFNGIRGHFDYIHIKDAKFDKVNGTHAFTYCGEGDGLIADILAKVIKEDGYDGVISIEPHIAAIVHEGSESSKGDEIMFESYIRYGRKLEAIISSL